MEKKEIPQGIFNENDYSIDGNGEITEVNNPGILDKNGSISSIQSVLESNSTKNSTFGKTFNLLT